MPGGLTNEKRKSMVDDKWRDIPCAFNRLAKRNPFSIAKIKKKWFDVKNQTKRDVALFKIEASPTGEGPKPIPKPTKLLKFRTLSEAYTRHRFMRYW